MLLVLDVAECGTLDPGPFRRTAPLTSRSKPEHAIKRSQDRDDGDDQEGNPDPFQLTQQLFGLIVAHGSVIELEAF